MAKGDSSWRLLRSRDSDAVAFGFSPLPGLHKAANGTMTVNDGQWHYVAGTYDGVSLCFYVDGLRDRCESATGAIHVNDQPVFIGANSEQPGRSWHGLIDDVRIYSYALSPSDVRTLYEGRKVSPLQ